MRRNRVYWNNEYIDDYLLDNEGNVVSLEEYGELGGILKNAIVEYSTGLKDKNGVEIYEGDIYITDFANGKIIKYIVEYDLENGRYIGKSINPVFAILYLTKEITRNSFEVIGNIHDIQQSNTTQSNTTQEEN